MPPFSFRSAGESHGPAILAILEGLPFGLPLDTQPIDAALARRQRGFGRSSRMQLEHDQVEILAGTYHGRTSGAPLALRIANVDRSLDTLPPVHRPRPGHADLAGALRFATDDARPVLERASARETAARVAAGAVVRQLLAPFGIEVDAFVRTIGGGDAAAIPEDVVEARRLRDASELGVADPAVEEGMKERIRAAARAGDTLGGTFVVRARGVPAGLGSLEQWERRLDARIGAAMLSIPSAKGVEIGDGFAGAAASGSRVHDPILPGAPGRRFARPTNRAGGIEGGMTNGEEVVVTVAVKPLATLRAPLPSVDLRTGRKAEPDPQRSDVCAVPAAAVVGEAMLLLVLAEAFLDRFGGPTVDDVREAFERQAARRAGPPA